MFTVVSLVSALGKEWKIIAIPCLQMRELLVYLSITYGHVSNNSLVDSIQVISHRT